MPRAVPESSMPISFTSYSRRCADASTSCLAYELSFLRLFTEDAVRLLCGCYRISSSWSARKRTCRPKALLLYRWGKFARTVSLLLAPLPANAATTINQLRRNLEGCRIGFDLGGSDRKCAALINGKVVFSEEVRWDPYFCDDPQYHYDGISKHLYY